MTRSVLVTGANSGIGLKTALHLASIGFRVIGTVRSQEKAAMVARAAAASHVEVETVLLDVTDRDACREIVEAYDLYGLVNNAGYMNAGAIEDVGPDEALRLLDTLVVAPMHLACLALPGMRMRGAGRIVNISSAAAHTTMTLVGWYQAAKHALNAVTSTLRIEAAGTGIDIVLIEPGRFRTGIWDKAATELAGRIPGSLYTAPYAGVIERIPRFAPRGGDPADVARTVGKALTAGQPQRRYVCGADAGPFEICSHLAPSSVKDRLGRLGLRLLARR